MTVVRPLLFALAMLVALAWTRAGAMAQEVQRLALLIANQSYGPEVGPLKNPHNDIRLVGTALGHVGFNLGTPLRDATREQILVAVHDFADRLAAAGPGTVSFLYYSGHGVAVGGDNIVVPVNVKGTAQRELAIAGVKLDEIAATLNERAPQALHFIVFDACRNNLAGTRGAKGFVPVAERPGMFISFSTAPGSTASDDGQESGPYAAALASEIVLPGRNHGDMFFEVRRRVAAATRHQQIPWTQDGLLRRVHLGGPVDATGGDLGAQPRPAPMSEAAQVWAVTKETTDKGVLEAFIARYKDTFYAELARAHLRSLEAKPQPTVTTSLPVPLPLAPSKEHPFDGTWEATWAGREQCLKRSGKYTIGVRGSVVQGLGGSVDAGGGVTFNTPNPVRKDLTVRHTLKLAGNSGTGTFLTIGTNCTGTETVRRLAPPEPSQPSTATNSVASIDPVGFDGIWQVTRIGENCKNPELAFQLVISDDRVGGTLSFGKITGTISRAGAINFAHKNSSSGAPDLRYTGKFAGGRGAGTFLVVGRTCRGTFTATLQ